MTTGAVSQHSGDNPQPAPTLACVDVPALPLQILARREPQVVHTPAAVVSEDRPGGIVLWPNRKARALRVLPGMRLGAAMALAPDLRVGVVEPAEINQELARLSELLRHHSPDVEPSSQEPGVFWVGTAGLLGLYGTQGHWAAEVRATLQTASYFSAVAVGFGRFALYAIARGMRGVRVVPSPAVEARLVAQVRLDALGPLLGPGREVHTALALLGVHTLGEFLALPAEALHERLGEPARTLHRKLHGELQLPLRPERPVLPAEDLRELEPPALHTDQLLFAARAMLHGLLRVTAARGEAVAALQLTLHLERSRSDVEPVRLQQTLAPADPSLDEAQLIELVRLYLAGLTLPEAVTRMVLRLDGRPTSATNLRLWQLAGKRDLDAAQQGLARLRAAYGPSVIVHAELRPNHLPEARFVWLPAGAPSPRTRPAPDRPPEAAAEPPRILARRLYAKPRLLPPRPKHEPDCWPIADGRQGTVSRLWGPFRITGGWWVREVRRDYFYVETDAGDLLWVYYDAVRRGWYLQGKVD